MNKKIRNATPLTYDGITFRSKLEAFTYKKLLEIGIKPEYENEKFILIPAFTFQSEKIRAMTYTPDFIFKDHKDILHIVECKGFANDVFPYKWKIFKWRLKENGKENFLLHVVKNQKQVNEMINNLNDEKG